MIIIKIIIDFAFYYYSSYFHFNSMPILYFLFSFFFLNIIVIYYVIYIFYFISGRIGSLE